METSGENHNSFAPPAQSDKVQPGIRRLDLGDFWLEGDIVWCGKEVFLPTYCVLTGSEDDLELIEKRLVFVPLWGKLTTLVFGWLLPFILSWLIMHGAFGSTCKVSYFVQRRFIIRNRWVTAFGSCLLIVALTMMLFIVTDLRNFRLLDLAAPLGIIVVTVLLAFFVGVNPYPVRIVGLKNGAVFQLKGFREPFFKRLEEM